MSVSSRSISPLWPSMTSTASTSLGVLRISVSLMLKRLCDELSDDQFIFNNQHRLSPREQTVDPVRLT